MRKFTVILFCFLLAHAGVSGSSGVIQNSNFTISAWTAYTTFAPYAANDVLSFASASIRSGYANGIYDKIATGKFFNGLTAGVDCGFSLTSDLHLVFRGEYLVIIPINIVRENINQFERLGITETFEFLHVPVMAGFTYKFYSDDNCAINLGLYAGLSYTIHARKLHYVNYDYSGGSYNSTDQKFSASAWAPVFETEINFIFPVSDNIDFCVKTGYRISKVSGLKTSNDTNYLLSPDVIVGGDKEPSVFDLSGLITGISLSFKF